MTSVSMNDQITSIYKYDNPQPFDSIGLFTYLRTYARRHIEDDPNSTIESWNECITRVVNATNTQLGVGFSADERQEVFDYLYNLKGSVAGRFLWQLGTKTVDQLGLMSLQNCAFTKIDDPVKPFTWIMNFLMLGAGCGYRILPEDLEKIPIIQLVSVVRNDTKDADFIVPDSRQGWIKLLSKLLKAHFYSGKSFSYSCQLLRSRGAPIKGFGGTASGPDTLCEGIADINKMLNENAGKKMTSIVALDICNIIGRVVVSGNVRRCLPAGSQVHTDLGRVAIEDIKVGDLVLTTKGYYPVLNVFKQGVQKIVKITTVDGTFLCTANHKMAVYTPSMFNYFCSGLIGPRYTWKEARDLTPQDSLVFIEYRLSSVTQKASQITNIDLNFMEMDPKPCPSHNGGCETKHFIPVERETYDIEVETMHEFFCDGFLTHNSAQICLGDAKDKEYLRAKRYDLGNVPNYRCYSNNSVICNDINDLLDNDEFWAGYLAGGEPYGIGNIDLCKKIGRLGETQYPDPTAEGFNPCIAGDTTIYTEDGPKLVTELLGKKVNLYVDGELHATDERGFYNTGVQLLYELTTAEGYSVRATANHKFMKMNLDTTEEWIELKDLKVGDRVRIHSHTKSTYKEPYPDWKQMRRCAQKIQLYELRHGHETIIPNAIHTSIHTHSATVIGICPDTTELVYDCTVPTIHAFDANGFYVHNCAEQTLADKETCCLAEIYLPNITSEEELHKVARYLYRICKHSLAMKCLDSKETEDIVHKNMRMGIGVTGYLQCTVQKGWLDGCYKMLRAFDVEYSQLHGFPTSVKLTTTKPSGTLSLLGHTTSGCHPAYARYMIRRIRVSSESKLIKLAQDHGFHIEYQLGYDGKIDYSTKIISFPYSYPEGTVLAEDCTAIQQLEYVKELQTNWSDNSISVTVYFRKEELEDIKKWLKVNYNESVKSISFLLHNEHGFIQAPLEKITEEQYNEMVKNTRPFTSVDGICYNSKDDEFLQNDCIGGACPIR